MSQRDATERNIELSRRAVDAWNCQDVDAVIALCDPACTWEPALEATTDGRRYEGHDGWRQYFQDFAEIAETVHFEVREYRAVGDLVVGLGQVRIVWKSGVELVQDMATIWTWGSGKVTAVTGYLDQAEALAVAGLSG